MSRRVSRQGVTSHSMGPDDTSRRALGFATAGIALWFASALGCVLSGAFVVGRDAVPWLLLAHLVGPAIAFVVAYRVSAALRAAAARIDPRVLVSLHAFRFVGLGFVALGHVGVLSPLFAGTAGLTRGSVAGRSTRPMPTGRYRQRRHSARSGSCAEEA